MIERLGRALARGVATGLLAVATAATAQIPFTAAVPSTGANNAFPAQNPLAPTGAASQVNYPYPGQCLADPLHRALFQGLPACDTTNAPSFACASTGGVANQSAGGWATCGGVIPFKVLSPVVPSSVPAPGALATPKFHWEVLNPPDYTPDTTTFNGADYYEIGVHEAWGFQGIASAGLFPDPLKVGGIPVPNGMQWTGLLCTNPSGCTCPAGLDATFKARYCAAGTAAAPLIPAGAPLFTPIWGVGQLKTAKMKTRGTVTNLLGSPCGKDANGNEVACPTAPWSSNDYHATWPSISIRGTKGTPVVVRWVNEFPNNHLFCPHPEAADWPCAIDRTFMGVKASVDPALKPSGVAKASGVNQFGSPQQPDNSWVTHLHGGEIPPSTDGFAEKWFGNAVTGAAYSPKPVFVNPPFENPSGIELERPAGNSDTYTYPMVNEEATIWFHDHTLGKTHHNVIAGPAGFFPVKDPAKHGPVVNGACQQGANCDYTWLDPVTEPRSALGIPMYDLFLAIQDRAFNEDGTINFSNGLGQPVPVPLLAAGMTPVTPGVNPQVHPTWLPEYFGDHVLVNGVLWPKKATQPGWYRLRLVDGSDSRCWTIGLSTAQPAPGARPNNNVPFWVIANDQGYLKNPVLAPGRTLTMCPGERYELLVNFGSLPGIPAGGSASVFMTNTAAAPFPAGITPQAVGSPYAEMNVVMRFDVNAQNGAGVKSCGAPGAPKALTWGDATLANAPCMPANPALQTDRSFVDIRPAQPFGPGTIVRQIYLNERLDGVTLAPLGMQLNGVPFEYKVTETPKAGSREVWQFINLTVDAHPIHPHLIKHQIVSRQTFNVGRYKAALCGSTTCQPGTAPGGEMQVVPDVTPFLTSAPAPVTAASVEGGWKDATQVPPGKVTTIVADWISHWTAAGPNQKPNAPGTAGCPNGRTDCAAPYLYEPVTSGPYVWHCHINSHEDSEMMRTSLVVP